MSSSVRKWCDAASQSANGRIALSNLLHDLEEGRVSQQVIAQFLTMVQAVWASARPGSSPELLIRRIAKDDPNGSFYRQGQPGIAPAACSRVLLAKDFIREHVLTDALMWSDCPDFVPEEYLDDLELTLAGKVSGDLPSRKPFAWVTRTEALAAVTESSAAADRATRVRDALGLMHYFGEVQLVALHYPDNAFAEPGTLRPPTFLDGSPYIVFCCFSDASGWGRTLHLGAGTGLPEAVHAPVALSAEFSIKRLGYTRSVSWKIDFDEVWKNAGHPWNSSQIDRLEAILSGTTP